MGFPSPNAGLKKAKAWNAASARHSRGMHTKPRSRFLFSVVVAAGWLALVRPVRGEESPLAGLQGQVSAGLLQQLPGRLAPPTAPSAGAGVYATQFKPTGQRLLVDEMLRGLVPDAEQRAPLRKAIDEAFAGFETQAAASGLANDVAAAAALYVAAADLAFSGHEMTDAQSEVVARQLRAALSGPEMRAASDREKQQLYEFMGTFAFYLLTVRQIAIEQNDTELMGTAKQLGAGALQWLFKVPPETVKVGPEGLALVKSATPNPAPEVMSIIGVWRGIGTGSSLHSTTNASGTGFSSFGFTSGGIRVREVAFFMDGWFTVLSPAERLAGIDHAAAAAKEPNYWGRYVFDGRSAGSITYADGIVRPFEIVDGKLHYDNFEFPTHRALP